MSDSFFDLDNTGPREQDTSFLEEEDDTDYDALNGETFGEDGQSSDWEESHERMTSEMASRTFDDENNELSERVASSILDDESEELSPVKAAKPPTSGTDSGDWWNENQQRTGGPSTSNTAQGSMVDTWWDPNMTQNASNRVAQYTEPSMAPAGKVHTVVEVEAQLRKDAEVGKRTSPSGAPKRMGRPEPLMNGHYSQNRPSGSGRGMMNQRGGMGGRFMRNRHEAMGHPERFHHHGYHHNAPFKDGLPMPMPMRPPMHRHPGPPRHPRMMFPRHPVMMRHPAPPFYPMQPQQNSYRHRAPNPRLTSPPIEDEYAGLMNNYEKNFVASIQMHQLNSSQPYQDDYYFTMYIYRQQGNSGRKVANHNVKNREATPLRPAATYTPLQFENSLGKLQIGSVTAPRKIIDMDLVENVENNHKIADKKSKQILIEIEEIYNIVLQMEDIYNPLCTQLENVNMVRLEDRVVNMLLVEHKLVQVMSIRKGRKLVLRMVPMLFTPQPLIQQLLVDLVPITRKDPEQLLLSFLPAIRTFLGTASMETLSLVTQKYDVPFFLSSKFMISVMANMVERAEALWSDGNIEPAEVTLWLKTLLRLAEATEHWEESERPVVAVDREVVTRHVSRVYGRITDQQISDLIRALSNMNQPAKPTNTATPTTQSPPTTTSGN